MKIEWLNNYLYFITENNKRHYITQFGILPRSLNDLFKEHYGDAIKYVVPNSNIIKHIKGK